MIFYKLEKSWYLQIKKNIKKN